MISVANYPFSHEIHHMPFSISSINKQAIITKNKIEKVILEIIAAIRTCRDSRLTSQRSVDWQTNEFYRHIANFINSKTDRDLKKQTETISKLNQNEK